MSTVSSPGPPSVPLPDAWAEQERRRAAHRARRRRRRLRWAAAGVAVAAVGVAAWVVAALPAPGADTIVTSSPPPTGPPPSTIVRPTTVPPGALVRLEEVWLLDRGDGTFDWGLVVASIAAVDRVDVTVTARLVDGSGEIAEVIEDRISRLPAGARVAVGGVVRGLAPVRVEADVVVGRESERTEPGTITVRAVERRVDVRGDRGEVLTGRLASTLAEEAAVRLGAIWRDEDGVVVAAVFHDVDRVRPNVEARFEIPLDGLVVPDGPPGEVLVAR